MPETGVHVLVAGVSTRALAESAARAGYRVSAVDAFGDADLCALARVVPLRRDGPFPYGADAAALAARTVKAELVAYTSNFENHPAAVAALARGRRLLGNPPAVLARVRNPLLLSRALAARGLAAPITRASSPAGRPDERRWLLKPRRSGGGHGIVPWTGGRSVPRHAYLQERIAGLPGSVVFAADGRHAAPLGFTRQLVGEAAFGAHGFRYCGSLLASTRDRLFPRHSVLFDGAAALAEAATASFGLRGLNGIDFIARNGVPFALEVNPRYSASMELIERATGLSLFGIHVGACAGRRTAPPPPAGRVLGKAIVFARHDVVIDDPHRWGVEAADVPHPGERIPAGRPICTVFAESRSADRCRTALEAAAARVYRATARRTRRAA